MTRGRVQAPDLAGPVPLQGGNVPGDTFTGAPQPVIDNNLGRVADALSGFNSALNQWGTVQARKDAKAQQDQETAIANKLILGLSRDQWNEKVDQGQIPNFANPFARALVEKHSGFMAADRDTNSIQLRIGRPASDGGIDLLDPSTDIGKIVTDQATQTLQSMPPSLQQSAPAMAGYRQRLDTFREGLVLKQQQLREKAFTEQLKGVAFDQFNHVFETTAGAAPEVVQSRIRGVYQDLSSSKGGQLSNSLMDEKLVDAIRAGVENPGTVSAALYALTVDRTGVSGEKVPALAANPRFAQEVAAIRNLARNTLTAKFDADTKELAVNNATDALKRQDGSWWSFTNTTYQNKYALPGQQERTLSADEIKKAATDRYLTWSKDQQAERNETAGARFERDWNVLQGANIQNPEWKQSLEGAATVFSNPQALNDPEKRSQAISSAELYMTGAQRNGPYMKGLVNKQAQDFYTVYDVARSGMGLNQDRALDMAAKAVRTTDNENDLAVRSVRATEVAQKVAGIDWGTSFWHYIPGFNANAENQGIIQKRVLDVASVLARTQDMTIDDAVKHSVDIVQKRSLFVNGHAVPDTGYMPPKDAQPLIEKYLEQFAKQHGAENNVQRGGDLSIEPYAGNTFRIVDRGSGFATPLYIKNGEGKVVPAVITMAMIQSMKDQNDNDFAKTVQQRQRENVVKAQEVQDKNLINTPDRFLSPEQKEQKKNTTMPASLKGPGVSGGIGLQGSMTEVSPDIFNGMFDKLFSPGNPRTGGRRK